MHNRQAKHRPPASAPALAWFKKRDSVLLSKYIVASGYRILQIVHGGKPSRFHSSFDNRETFTVKVFQ